MRLFIQTNTKITIVFAVLAQLQTDITANIRKAVFIVHTSFQPFPTFDFSLKFSAKALFLLFEFKNICNYYIHSNYSTLVPPRKTLALNMCKTPASLARRIPPAALQLSASARFLHCLLYILPDCGCVIKIYNKKFLHQQAG